MECKDLNFFFPSFPAAEMPLMITAGPAMTSMPPAGMVPPGMMPGGPGPYPTPGMQPQAPGFYGGQF